MVDDAFDPRRDGGYAVRRLREGGPIMALLGGEGEGR